MVIRGMYFFFWYRSWYNGNRVRYVPINGRGAIRSVRRQWYPQGCEDSFPIQDDRLGHRKKVYQNKALIIHFVDLFCPGIVYW